VATLICPFKHCHGTYEPIPQLKSVGSDEIEYVYPRHDVQGANHWFGACPASFFLIIGWPESSNITPYARSVLVDAEASYERLAAENPAPPDSSGVGSPSPLPKRTATFGGPAVDARGNLRGMVEMTINAIDRSLGNIAAMSTALEEMERQGVTCETQADAALALARAAVGDDTTLPEPAHRMLGELINAHAMARGDSGDVLPAIAAVRSVLTNLLGTYGSAREAATEYLAVP
jgi:hypothetical protein